MCPIPKDELGEDKSLPVRALPPVFEALSRVDDPPSVYTNACKEAGIKPIIHPFWEHLPYIHIFRSITPDILHQLYQGVIKHVVSWISEAFSPVEIDARCRCLPPNHNVRVFLKGITTLSRVSGKEHADMCKILLGLVTDMRTISGASAIQVVRAVCGLLNFLYIAQFPTTVMKLSTPSPRRCQHSTRTRSFFRNLESATTSTFQKSIPCSTT